jgi:peptidoglycan/xylan/chitin deacetylase (PgdA/CDA1 family)
MRTRRAKLVPILALALLAGMGLALRPGAVPAAKVHAAMSSPAKDWHSGKPTRLRAASAPLAAHRVTEPVLHLPVRLPRRRVVLPILMYHRIDRITPDLPSITRALTVDPADFARQMDWVKAHGYHTVTQIQLWNALMRGRPLPHHPVLITFDDAYRDVVTYAAPVLRRDHQHATAYVITDRLSHGRLSPWMLWSQLPLLERDGFDIGSHTVSHADLVAAGPLEAGFQLRASRFALQRYLHKPVQWLAYPYGRVDPTVERLARAAGYVLAVTTKAGVAQDASAPLLLHRDEVTGTMGVAGLASLLNASR